MTFAPTGEMRAVWGWAGSGLGEFNSPRGITIGPSDDVYVADEGNQRVQIFRRAAR